MTREEMIAAAVTLNGRPAKVCGRRNDYATVVDLESGLGAEWAWPTVERVITEGGGRFRT